MMPSCDQFLPDTAPRAAFRRFKTPHFPRQSMPHVRAEKSRQLNGLPAAGES